MSPIITHSLAIAAGAIGGVAAVANWIYDRGQRYGYEKRVIEELCEFKKKMEKK